MYKVQVEIQTIVPYKQDRFTEKNKDRADKGKSSKKDTWDQRQKDWEDKIYKDNKGCYVPVSHIYHSLLNGLSGQPPLVSNKVKLNKPTTKATIFIEESKIYIYNGKIKKKYDEMDVFSTVNKNAIGKPRVTSAHPMFNPPLTASFTINVTQDYLLPEVLKEGLERAGQCYGIGAGRPIYGRFLVKKFKVSK